MGNAIISGEEYFLNGDLNSNSQMEGMDYCAEIQLVLGTVSSGNFPYEPGDLNIDSSVDVLDLTILGDYLSSIEITPPIDVIIGDMNGDCLLDDKDYNILIMLILEKLTKEELPYQF